MSAAAASATRQVSAVIICTSSTARTFAGSAIASSSDSGPFPIEPRPAFVLLSAGIGMAIALISAIIPYRKTARLDPIEALRRE